MKKAKITVLIGMILLIGSMSACLGTKQTEEETSSTGMIISVGWETVEKSSSISEPVDEREEVWEVTGIIAELWDRDEDYAFLLYVSPKDQGMTGDLTNTGIEKSQVFKDGEIYTALKPGDKVKLTVMGYVRESYPTQISSIRADVIKEGADTMTIDDVYVPGHENPYVAAFEVLWNMDKKNNPQSDGHVTVNFYGAMQEELETFETAFSRFCGIHGLTFSIQSSKDGMGEEVNRSTDLEIVFADYAFNENELKIWSQRLSAGEPEMGYLITLQFADGEWSLKEVQENVCEKLY